MPLVLGQELSGSLGAGDDKISDGSYADIWVYQGRRGETLTMIQRSRDMDSYLTFGATENGRWTWQTADNNGAGGKDSRLVVTLERDGEYWVRPNALFSGEGRYTLVVTSDRVGGPAPVTPAGPAPTTQTEGDSTVGDTSGTPAAHLPAKRLEPAAGLGGGSSDAAAAWRLGRAWQGLPDVAGDNELASLAAIGADVPFFAAATPAALVSGIGERVSAVPPTAAEVVLVHPPFGLSTKEIFANLAHDEWNRQENDLLAPALRLRPELDDLFGLVAASGGRPRLTGSGPTIFSLDDDPDRAAGLATSLAERGLRTTHTRTRTTAPSIERIEEEPDR